MASHNACPSFSVVINLLAVLLNTLDRFTFVRHQNLLRHGLCRSLFFPLIAIIAVTFSTYNEIELYVTTGTHLKDYVLK